MFRKFKKKIIYCVIVTLVNIAFGEKGWSMANCPVAPVAPVAVPIMEMVEVV